MRLTLFTIDLECGCWIWTRVIEISFSIYILFIDTAVGETEEGMESGMGNSSGILSSLANNLHSDLRFSDVVMAFTGLFIFSSIVRSFSNKGPMLWPMVGMLPSVFLHSNDLLGYITRALIRCGGTFPYRGLWLGSSGFITSDPSKVEYILKTRFSNFPKGRYYRERFHDLLGDGIFNADDVLWKQQRRTAILEMHSDDFITYSMQIVQNLVHQKLLKLMEKLASSKESIDLQELLLRFTFDNICTAAFGINPGCLSQDLPDVPFAKAFEEAAELTLVRFITPPFVWKIMKVLGVGFERRLSDAVQIVHDFSEKTVGDRKRTIASSVSLNSRSDILSRLISHRHVDESAKTKSFSDKLLQDFCISFILAGRDTGSVALTWFFWVIHKNPIVEKQILEEIQGIAGGRQFGTEEIIFTTEDLNRMVYLQAALSEAMRLYPPVPIDFKEVLEDDVFPDGTVVKKGYKVMYSIFSMARMESIWGKDCLEFKPERWLKDGKFVSANQFKYPVFNAGPRMCVGKNLAQIQMKMVAASVLLRYSIQVVEGHCVHPKLTTTLHMKHGLHVRLVPRLETH